MIALNWSGSMFVPQRSLFVPTRNRLVACLASGINAEQLRTQLDHLQSEADEARAKASISVNNTDLSGTTGSTQLIQFNPASQLPIKLSGSNNFSTWKTQFELLLDGYDLYGHLDGSKAAPPSTITRDGKQSPNSEFRLWVRQDKLIHNALLASVEPTLSSLVASASSSKGAWDSLHLSFANKSQTRILSLRDQLSRVTKNMKPVAEYLRDIRSLVDELAIAGSPVSNEELIVKILSGLGSEYDMIAAAIRARPSSISYEELSGILQDQEIVLKTAELKTTSNPITAAPASREPSVPQPQSGNWQPPHVHSPTRRNTQPNPWRSRSSQPMNQNWHYNTNQGSDSSRYTNRLRCQLCDKPGHTAKVCRSKSHNHIQAKAHFVSSMHQPSAPWIVDSGASHHIASDTHNFAEVQGYNGPDEISMGDGKKIPISHTGTAFLHGDTYKFKLGNTLCAPKINRNLLSVSQFCNDNLTSVEFFPSKFCVKDLATGTPLICGRNNAGIYEWPSSSVNSAPSAHVASRQVPIHLWHQRLGHPHIKSLKVVLQNFSLPYCQFDKFNFCNSCLCNKSHRLPFSTISLRSSHPLQIIYSDLWGPSPVLSFDKKLYYVIFVDLYTKYSWLYTLKHKDEVLNIFQQFQTLVERYFKHKITSLYTDGGGEFEGLRQYLTAQGIEHLKSPPYTPQRVVFAERKHRHVIDTARTLLHQASLPSVYWSFASNRARLRLLRLSEAAEKLQRQALSSVQTGRENDARDLLVRKKNVMHALENLKSRIDLFDKLSAKLNEAISLKESQLVNAVTVDFVDGEEASAEVHIVPPKEETAINTEESKESDANFLALGYDRQSEADPGDQEEESSHNDTKIPDGISIGSHQSEANLVSRVKEISSYEDFLGHLDQQLNNIETELNTFLMFSTMISEGGEKLVNLKLQQTGEILEGVCRIRKRIASIKQTKNVDQIENSSSEVNYSQVNSSKLLET